MTGAIITAVIHHLAAFTIFSAVIFQYLLLGADLTAKDIKQLKIVNLFLNISLVVVLIAGFHRVFMFEKGGAYYMKNGAFHAKFTLFLIFALVTIYPTLKLSNWSRAISDGQSPDLSEALIKKFKMCLRIEKLLLLLIIITAVLMAKGVGSFG
ncbi:MAG: DUF2214 family protein [Bdellovibrionota bacterium]